MRSSTPVTAAEALRRMEALCCRSEHCESDIRQRLAREGLSQTDIDDVIGQLYYNSFIDTGRYCRAYAADQMRFAHWGRQKIAMSLRAKGLPQADIDEALRQLPQEEYRQMLDRLVQQRFRQTPKPPRQKLIQYLLARGFTYDEVVCVMDDVDCNEDA